MSCDAATLDRLPWPAPSDTPAAVREEHDGRVGVRVAVRSAFPPDAWLPVLRAPEEADAWLPADLGVRRIDRVDPTHLYQQFDVPVLLGAVRIRRQVLMEVVWSETGERLRNCWRAVDPGPFLGGLPRWDAPWHGDVYGGWQVDPLPDGGSFVSYQIWTATKAVLPRVQAWASARTLPELVDAYAERVAGGR